jgi:hypothetical protein
MPIRRLSMTAQVKKTHLKLGTGRMGPGKVGRPRRTLQRSSGLTSAAKHKQNLRLMRMGLQTDKDSATVRPLPLRKGAAMMSKTIAAPLLQRPK